MNQVLIEAAHGHYDKKNYAEAADLYHQHLKLCPNDDLAWSLYGMCLFNLRKYIESVSAFRKSLNLKEDIPTWNVLVMALFESGNQVEAAREGSMLLRKKDELAVVAYKTSCSADLVMPKGTSGKDKIISFSLWGDRPEYTFGAILNAQLLPFIYIGWRGRFYCDSSVPVSVTDEIKRLGSEIVVVTDSDLQGIRGHWRFFVANDSGVERFVCRDTDSRLNVQEFLAVDNWQRSQFAFHIMRDHVYHMELMLAGMWGGLGGVLPSIPDAVLSDRRFYENSFGDQLFLAERVWPIARQSVLIHDSIYSEFGSKPFPGEYRLPRPGHVGASVKSLSPWRLA